MDGQGALGVASGLEAQVSKPRRMAVFALLGLFVGGHGYAIVTERELWPLSHYPMYSTPRGDVIHTRELVGIPVDAGLGPVELDVRKHFRPFDNTRLHWALDLIRRQRSSAASRKAMRRLFERYDRARAEGLHNDPPLAEIRSYRVRRPIDHRTLGVGKARRRLEFSAQAEAVSGERR